jgi:magnesium-transporting ATPase (P-type)
LKTNLQRGLVPTNLSQRSSHFGSNRKDPPERTPYWKFFIGAIDDFMLKLLLVCACVDIGFEVGFAHDDDERKTGKYLASIALVLPLPL